MCLFFSSQFEFRVLFTQHFDRMWFSLNQTLFSVRCSAFSRSPTFGSSTRQCAFFATWHSIFSSFFWIGLFYEIGNWHFQNFFFFFDGSLPWSSSLLCFHFNLNCQTNSSMWADGHWANRQCKVFCIYGWLILFWLVAIRVRFQLQFQS